MPQFNSYFQHAAKFIGAEVRTVAEIESALSHSYLAQNAVNPKRVLDLVKSIVKDKCLWQHPKLVYVKSSDTWVLAGGRHRLHAVAAIAKQYAVNAKGGLVKLDPSTESANLEVDAIEPAVEVLLFEVANKVDLVAFLQADNGSRSMTTEEKSAGKEYAQTLTAVESLKLSLGKAMFAELNGEAIMLSAGENMPSASVVVTKETCRQMAVKFASLIGKRFKFITQPQIEEFALEAIDYLKQNSENYNSNFSRTGFKEFVEDLATIESPEPVFDDKSEPIEDATWIMWFASQIDEPAKKATKTSAVAEQEAKIEKLKALLLSAGIDESALAEALG